MVNIMEPMELLSSEQEEAYETFKKDGYIVMDSARQVGKTTVLRKILFEECKRLEEIDQSGGNSGRYPKSVKLVVLGRSVAEKAYLNDLPHRYRRHVDVCVGIRGLIDEYRDRDRSLIVADEVYVNPFDWDVPVACGITFSHKRFNLVPPPTDTGYWTGYNRLKDELTEEEFEIAYGRLPVNG